MVTTKKTKKKSCPKCGGNGGEYKDKNGFDYFIYCKKCNGDGEI